MKFIWGMELLHYSLKKIFKRNYDSLIERYSKQVRPQFEADWQNTQIPLPFETLRSYFSPRFYISMKTYHLLIVIGILSY